MLSLRYWLVMLTLGAWCASFAQAAPVVYYVSPTGNDAWSGNRPDPVGTDGPLATLTKARDAIRQLRQTPEGAQAPVTVYLRGGVYRLRDTFALTAADSGTAAAPVIWQAMPGEAVRLVGGVRLTGFAPVTDAAVRERLSSAARDHVQVVDLKAQGVTNLGVVQPGNQKAEVFFNNRYLTLARYPNEGWERIAAIPEEVATKRPISDPKRPDLNRYEGPFIYSGDRPRRWTRAEDVWVHGYWLHDWSDQHHRVQKFDLDKRELWVQPPYHSYGYKKNQRYYYYNVLEELDAPGEWYLDRAGGQLYLWPPGPLAEAEVLFPELEKPLVQLEGVQHVSLRGLVLEGSRAAGLIVKGGAHNEIAGCTVRNVGSTGIDLQGGERHRVQSCDVYEVAATAISVNGGDRQTLTPGNHVVANCHLHHFARVFKTYRPGVQLNGVGNRVTGCYIHDCPHAGIGYGGNDHIIEFTEFTRVAQETGDVGAIYTAMDWTYLGLVFRYNYFHDIHGPGALGCFTIYPDLPCGGIHLHGNIFDNVDQVFHTNSGRGMLIENNIMVRARRGMNFSAWSDAAKFKLGGNWRMVERLGEVKYDQPPYSTRYPVLARLAEDFALGEERVMERSLPKDNVIRRNVSWGESYFVNLRPATVSLAHVQVENNLIADPLPFTGSPTGDGKSVNFSNDNAEGREVLGKYGNVVVSGDPGFVDLAGGSYELKPDSPAWKLGFERIPFERIGLQRDAYRATLPALEPTIATPGGLFAGEQQVVLHPSKRGPQVELRYTLDGSEPTRQSLLYSAPLTLRQTTTVQVAAYSVGGTDSDRSATVSASYRLGKLGPEGGVYLSELPALEYDGYAPLGLLRDVAHHNAPLTLGGKTYTRGLITHPAERPDGNRGQATFALEGWLGDARRFTATIGIEGQAPTNMGSCAFAVEVRRGGKWERLFESKVIKSRQAPQPVDVTITGADRLRLVVTDGGDGIGWDHGVWADAKLQ